MRVTSVRSCPKMLARASSLLACSLASSPHSHHRLILTSSGLATPALTASFHRMLAAACADADVPPRVALLATAQMAPSGSSSRSAGEARRRRWASARKGALELERQLGVPVECICCATRPAEALRSLEAAPCLWVPGGNTFFLWHHLRESGAAARIQQRVARGMLYVGASAGAICAGRSIATAKWKGMDDPAAAPGTDWARPGSCNSMALAPDASFFPHYDPARHAALVAARRGELGHGVRCLADDGGGSYVRGDENGGQQGTQQGGGFEF